MKKTGINLPLLLLVGVVISCFALLGLTRLHIDTDVIKSLPSDQQIIDDALKILHNHPIHDQVAVDIMINREAPDILVACGDLLLARMKSSGLFTTTGLDDVSVLIPELAHHIVRDLPRLFSRQDLEHLVAPLLEDQAIRQRLHHLLTTMTGLESIGQAAFIAADPLGLKDLVLARMLPLTPAPGATLYKGHLLANDGRHLLVTAKPTAAGTDTASARQLAHFFAETGRELVQQYGQDGLEITLTPVGAYRAALDNEEIIRHDVRLALVVSTIGIALLLFITFPRPWLGLLSLVPALAGTSSALFIYSLFHSSISIIVLGFGGALISITVDHGIAYLLFLDRAQATDGARTAREVRSVGGLMALVTTMGAFLALSLANFPIFTQLGQFTALGLLCTFIFIHTIFPRIFPVMPPAAPATPPLHILVKRLNTLGWPGFIAALMLAMILLPFARPVFHIDLDAMSTVSEKTRAADRLFTSTWGGLDHKVYLMITADSMTVLQQHNDRLLPRLKQDIALERIAAAFVPSMLFPGREGSQRHQAAWQAFWTPERVAQVQEQLVTQGTALGFTADAFAPFFTLLDAPLSIPEHPFPEQYQQLMGISTGPTGELIQFITIHPGEQYDPVRFHEEYGATNALFDGRHFSAHLGDLLFSTFSLMLVVIAATITLLLFLLFLNWRLTCLALLPLVFAYICTLGTLYLIGHPLDIPGLMLSIVILGMGVDYTIYTVRGCQWYGSVDHPSHVLVRSTVLLAGTSTLIGFGVLCFAEHSLLRSVGITSFYGIAFALLGTFLLLPPLLRFFFRPEEHNSAPRGISPEQRIRHRYRLLEAYPRMFARCKLRFDPLFTELPRMLAQRQQIETIVDIGCGYGVPACWCLEHLPGTRVIGIDPDPDRVRVAARVTGDRGLILQGAAPELPALQGPVDVILLLDMLHYLDDDQVAATLCHCRDLLASGGIVLLRYVYRPPGKRSFFWHLEDLRVKFSGATPWYRTERDMAHMLTASGFTVAHQSAARNSELLWMTGRPGGQNT